MLHPTMMTDQQHPPLDATPMLPEVSLVPHMLNGDSMQQMILVQVNPGETFTIRTEDGHYQCITGPAHVPMVSPNGTMPPIFVPPGYVSQVVEENGMRKVVVLPHAAEFHPSIPPPLHVPQYLPPHPAMLHQHPMYPRDMPPHFMPQMPPPQVYGEQSEAAQKPALVFPQEQPRRRAGANTRASRSPPPSPQKGTTAAATSPAVLNGSNKGSAMPAASPGPPKNKPSSKNTAPTPPPVESTADADETRKEEQLLYAMSKPTVCSMLARSAVVSWEPPITSQGSEPPATPSPLTYELALSQSGNDGSFTPVYIGLETTFTVEDLRPATVYHVRVCAVCGSVRGNPSKTSNFTTQCAPPDAPAPPRLTVRSKSSLVLQWKAPNDNGSKITGYRLEYDEGKQSAFKEIYFGHAKQYKVIRLTPSTKYAFRLAAKNDVGLSEFSELLTCCTSGSAPPPLAPPRLSAAGVTWLTLEWSAPCGPAPTDVFTYTLEMEEEGSGYGFKPKYNGEELSYTVRGLRKNTAYKFRVLAANAEGRSQPSTAVEFSTAPDVPLAPGRPSVKGRVLPHSLHVAWDPPKDDGGSEVTQYVLEICQSQGGVWQVEYSGPLREHVCEGLEPGTWHSLRVYCQSAGGASQASDSLRVQTAPVPPGPCQPPRLGTKARPRELMLAWAAPAWDGGAAVSQYAVEMAETAEGLRRQLYQGTETDCTASSLLPGHVYCFWVKAANQAGWGPLSEMQELSTAPGPPEQCGAPELTVKTATCVLASWEVPACNGAEVTEFRLEWGAAEGSMTVAYSGSAHSYEVKGLQPATVYYCRVQAVNSAGVGLFGDVGMVTTPPSVPAAVRAVEVVTEDALPEGLPAPTSSCLALKWEEPCCHGAEVTGYNIDFGEQPPLSVGKTNYYVLENLQPDAVYRVRVQAVNSVGVGPFSTVLKAKTRPLPPEPPLLECAASGPQSLKLKWGEGPSRTQLSRAMQYCLHMQASADRMLCIYSGPCHTFKVQRLSEATAYHFSIQAHNEAGMGPMSQLYSFSTTRSAPSQLKAPRIELLGCNHYEVTWEASPMRGDPIVYILQLQRGRDGEQLYRGAATSYSWQSSSPGGDWRLRVCAGRVCQDGTELWGQYSPSSVLPVLDLAGASQGEVKSLTRDASHTGSTRTITDEQFALLLLLGFATVAILFAVIIQYFVIK